MTKWSIKDVVVCRTVYGRMHLKHSLESVNDLSAELSMCDIWCIYGSRPYGGVSVAFWATLRGVTLYVVMTAHEY